jgi:hypothetical protein
MPLTWKKILQTRSVNTPSTLQQVYDYIGVFTKAFGIVLVCETGLRSCSDHSKTIGMLYLIAVILIIGWAIGFFAFSAGYLIHVLLILAIVAILLRLIRG